MKGTPYTLGEIRKVAERHKKIDPYHRDCLRWLLALVDTLTNERDEARRVCTDNEAENKRIRENVHIGRLLTERDTANADAANLKLMIAAMVNERDAAIHRPVPMLLWCPSCLERHIDVDEFATKPHHTHACQGCGMTWRPAIVPTVGVQFLPGFKNEV